jgi:hypothetical protein
MTLIDFNEIADRDVTITNAEYKEGRDGRSDSYFLHGHFTGESESWSCFTKGMYVLEFYTKRDGAPSGQYPVRVIHRKTPNSTHPSSYIWRAQVVNKLAPINGKAVETSTTVPEEALPF